MLILRQCLIHLDHLVIEAVSCCVKLGTTVVHIVFIQLFLTLLFTFIKKSFSLCLQARFTTFKAIVEDRLSYRLWFRLCFSLRRLGGLDWCICDFGSLDLSFEFFSLHTHYFSETLAFVGILSLAEIEARVLIIKR